jgi:hypothetical protein
LNEINLFKENCVLVIMEPKRVLIESPFKGAHWGQTRDNIFYARLCIRDSLSRGEAPFASHLFFTQTGILDDQIPGERKKGIEAGLAWGFLAELTAVYTDRGVSSGMEQGMESARACGRPIDYRELGDQMDVEAEIRNLANMKQFLETGVMF